MLKCIKNKFTCRIINIVNILYVTKYEKKHMENVKRPQSIKLKNYIYFF